jgi:hypothetical protein
LSDFEAQTFQVHLNHSTRTEALKDNFLPHGIMFTSFFKGSTFAAEHQNWHAVIHQYFDKAYKRL